MQARTQDYQCERRGIVLVLILGVLALMAIIGVTFATFSGQSRVSARNFAQSVNQPQRDELMDYALSQLISDTPDIRSSIRGHSLSRDMFGNDAAFNGYLTARPGGAGAVSPYNYSTFYITGVTAVSGTLYDLTTNIVQNDSAIYGYDFTNWILRVSYFGTYSAGPPTPTGTITQTLEILPVSGRSNGYQASSTSNLVFRVNIAATDQNPLLINLTAGTNVQLPGYYLNQAATNATNLGTACPFVLDGRWLHAFNGPGMTSNAVYGNFRYNGPLVGAGSNVVGMDEDYDAVDLENWFLAVQSADGSVIIPSFHRPSAIRVESNPTTGNVVVDDWLRQADTAVLPAWTWQDSASRILRPCAADGHDPTTFPDLRPNTTTGRITYDVDNDGDGQTDSVWLDLGYPARRNAQGQLYKPLFAFMVIGLNGRIPLNTAGNLAGRVNGIQYVTTPSTQTYGGGAAHAAHLGNSASEIDPTYALQNCFRATDIGTAGTVNGAFNPPSSVAGNTALDTQVDNAGIDVRLTQLRNLLAGTRPQPTPGVPGLQPGVLSPVNGDNNFVLINNIPYYMPNSVADPQDTIFYTDTTTNRIYVLRQNPPVAGRWGEPDSIIGGITAPPTAVNPINGYVNLVQDSFINPIRAGYSYDITDVLQGVARDAADDNYNAFDPYPTGHMGEANDSDMYDAAGALMLPVDRMRRYVTPADINGTGSVTPWTNGAIAGADTLGRVNFSSYYRPPGSPGSIASSLPTTATPAPTPGVIYYPSNASGNNFFYSNGPNNNPNTPALPYPTFLPDVTNNPLHAFEFFRLPPDVTPTSAITGHTITAAATFQFQRNGGMLLDQTLSSTGFPTGFPTSFPTYDYQVNASKQSDGLNDADEMNLYMPNPQADSPFGPSDLEWLYRLQDIDGTSLHSRLAQLAPVSFTNPVDGLRRRRLFALDTWEMNNFAWTNDNPGGNFSTNKRFVWGATPQNASFAQLSTNLGSIVPTPSLAHRDKKINLNYPLPVSNSPEEPVRQKWINDAYQLLKRVLPPMAVDTPEELAQLSQFLTNVIDFRDPDCTMTHFRNPDVEVVLGSNPSTPASPTCTYLAPIGQGIPNGSTAIPLDQYGMEYNPVAINEAMAYSFQGTSGSVNRFFVELVNTLSQSALGVLPAGAFGGGGTNPPDVSTLDLSLSNYDLVMTADDPVSRPDPFTGQLLPISTANYYAQLPFNQANSTTTSMFSPTLTNPPTAGDVLLTPLYSAGAPANPFAATDFNPGLAAGPANYFYVIGNADPKSEAIPYPTPTAYLSSAYDPFTGTMGGSTTVPTGVVPPGYCPNLQSIALAPALPAQVTLPNKMPLNITPLVGGSGSMQYYWVCLRRPANVFAPPQPDPTKVDSVTNLSTYNPMIVVDTMRFPYIEAGPAPGTNQIFSSQRCQPFRGGHSVRLPNDATTAAAALYTPYGYSEQMALPGNQPGGYGQNASGQVTKKYYNTIGAINDQAEPWDYFPFNDRDFTSVAELMLVPGCPPGLFTKQFVELAPMPPTTTAISGTPTLFPVPSQMPPNPPTAPAPFTTGVPMSPNAAIQFPAAVAGTAAQPHTYPYLVDKFFYSGYGGTAAPVPDPGTVVGGNAADGWFKMFEFFEVPGQALGAIGSVASGTDFDWARQDTKPGLLNLNLIIDEEVFFSLLGSQSARLSNGTAGTNTDSFSQLLLDFAQLPGSTNSIPQIVTESTSTGAAQTFYPLWDPSLPIQPGVVTNDPVNNNGGAFNGLKAAFAQFLILRHGANQNAAGYWLLYSANPERPFHSLSYPDINYTVMRPATLPPASPTYTGTGGGYASATYTGDPGVRNPYIYPWGPASMLASGAANTSFAGGTLFSVGGGATVNVAMPPPIPARRLFQKPDVYTNNVAVTYPPTPPTSTSTVSNASDSGDPFINFTQTTGALQALSTTGPYVNNGYPNLVWSGNTANVPNPGVYVGGNTSGADYSQHPYWRSEMMQRVMNLTTVRTHQYAVWITIGFFEVKREGDLLNIQAGSPILAFDILGPEVGASTGQTTRYRGFFLVDRLQLTGFDDTTPGSFRPAVVYRQMIE